MPTIGIEVNMHEEEKYYTIEYLAGRDSSDDGDWTVLTDTFGNPYQFEEASAALAKAGDIARQGKWGQPIKLRVMKCAIMINKWKLREFEPEDYYEK